MDQFLNVIGYCFACVSVVVVVLVWVHNTFQTKSDAEKSEMIFSKRIEDLKAEIGDVHKHVHAFRAEVKADMRDVQAELHAMRNEYGAIAKDLSYIKGRLEPKP